MFRYIKLKNYKSLISLDVDFTSKKNTPKNIILIYGENGVGKSNFISAFYTLFETMRTKSIKEFLNKIKEDIDAEANHEMPIQDFINFLKRDFKETENIITECKTIDSTDNMVIEVGFRIKNKNGVYRIETDDKKIIFEKLDFVLNKKRVNFFELYEESFHVNENIFNNQDYYSEICELIQKYFGKHSLLSILNYEINDKSESFMKKQISNSLFEVIKYFNGIYIHVNASYNSIKGKIGISNKLLEIPEFESGTITTKNIHRLDRTEELLNEFFTHLYSDIKQVYYQRQQKGKKVKYKLYFKKQIYNKLIDISSKNESTGTRKLLDLFPFFIGCLNNKISIIDEIDSGIHDILVDQVLQSLQQCLNGQLIFTTHNTLLLESDIPKDSIYVFRSDACSNKELIPITDIEGRIHPNLNIRKRYLNNIYGGAPTPMSIDFDDLAKILE